MEKLEKTIKKQLAPVVERTMHDVLGVTIDEINKDLTTKLEKGALLDFPIDTSIPYKQAKKQFKKHYLRKLLQIKYGNISEVAKQVGIDRRSVHRIVRETKLDVGTIRKEMAKAYEIKQHAVGHIIEDVLANYKQIIHPIKLSEAYRNVDAVSKVILDNLPEEPMPLKQAETEFEKEYIQKALQENDGNASLAAKKIGLRYETLHRKCKALGLLMGV